MRTYQPKSADVQRTWHVIDATDVVLGRLATQIAVLLRGKHHATRPPTNRDALIAGGGSRDPAWRKLLSGTLGLTLTVLAGSAAVVGYIVLPGLRWRWF